MNWLKQTICQALFHEVKEVKQEMFLGGSLFSRRRKNSLTYNSYNMAKARLTFFQAATNAHFFSEISLNS